ncbi:probable Golgi SNAP receptor complex member 2 [Cylas formicarius]|uniref:probable Golgi SNAP receptor complex member 2 n=1 Tax=Cylas formicarius TaxID=197179 RepID=UPI002958C5C4|nr:probable Golgi SNAP receptor complex member 2 [Cylas formicarius]
MDHLYNQTNKLIQDSFQVLEKSSLVTQETEDEIQEKINLISSNCAKLELQVFKLPIDRRQNAKLRSDQLKYDCKHLQAALAAVKKKRERRKLAETEREQLLNRRFGPEQDLIAINMDHSIQHQTSLQSSNRGVDEMLFTGTNTLESLRSQRMTLKGAQRRIMDMANTLGLSNHTMRLIEKRVSEDKVVFVLGVVITLTVIVLIIIYFT